MKTKLENGIEYRLENDIWYASFKLKEEDIKLGKYGLMKKGFLEEHYRYRFEAMLLTGELYTYCREIEGQAKEMEGRLIAQYKKKGCNLIMAEFMAHDFVVKDIITK